MSNDFVIHLRAVDSATAVINKLKNSFAKINEPLEKIQKRFDKVGSAGEGPLDKLNKSLDGVARSASKVVDRIVEIVPGLTALGGAASIAGLAALGEKFGTFGFNITKTSKLLGMSTSDLQTWHIAARKAGVSAEQFDQSMSSSQDAIRGAFNGARPDAMMILNKMHVAIQRNQDGSIDYLNTQERIMKALAAQKSVEGQRAAAGALGMTGALPMIQNGTWDEDRADAVRRKLVVSPAAIRRGDEFKRKVIDLQTSVEGFGNSVGEKLIPVLAPVVDLLTKWFDDHKAAVADKIAAAVERLTAWVSNVDWAGAAAKADKFVDSIGGVKGVAIAIAAITFAGPIASVVSLITSMATLTRVAVPAAIGALGSLGVAAGLAYAAIQVAKAAGLPDTDESKGKQDIRNGDWLAASAHMPAAEFAKAVWAKMGGQTDAEIAGAGPTNAKSPQNAEVVSKLQALGWAKPQAVGIAANLLQESHYDPTAVGDKGTAYGIAQWHEDRQADFQKWAGHGIRGSSLDEQLKFVDFELRNGKLRGAGDALGEQNSAAGAGRVVSQFYEMPGDRVGESIRRAAMAGQMYDGLNAGSQSSAPAGMATDDRARSERIAALQAQAVQISVAVSNAPPGTRVEAKTAGGEYLPTRVSYSMGGNMGAMP
jgi:hypothetical protein